MVEHDDTTPDGIAASVRTEKPAVSDLVNRYWTIGKRSVRAIIETGTVFFDAYKLGDDDFAVFHEQIKVALNGSTSKRFSKIGSKRSRLEKHIDRLPNNWTTIYELAALEDDQFQQLIDDDVLHRDVTWRAILGCFAKPSQNPSVHPGESLSQKPELFAFDWNRVALPRRSALAKKLKALFEEFEVYLDDAQCATLDSFIEQAAEEASHA
jgi:hypothetical protein